jgi:hypothetical protein
MNPNGDLRVVDTNFTSNPHGKNKTPRNILRLINYRTPKLNSKLRLLFSNPDGFGRLKQKTS